jgi:hypothetical protein
MMCSSQVTGATGFDRIATVTVACPGSLLGPVNNVGTLITADNVAVAGRVGYNAPVAMAA